MPGIVVALEPDIEVTRHHVSMVLPFTLVGFTAHKWDTKMVSAYDMMDAVDAKLVVCSHEEYHKNLGLQQYIAKNGLPCLMRYEAEGDAFGGAGGNCITYTRYPNTEFKEILPSCADIFNYKPVGELDKTPSYEISIKNYVNPRFFRTKIGENEKLNGFKMFRGYNVRNEYNFGDMPDADLCPLIHQARYGVSLYVDGESCITSDVFNILHCGVPCQCLSDTEEHMRKLIEDTFGQDTTQLLMKCDLPKKYTNFDRAITISKLFNLGVEKDLRNESVKYK